MLRTSRHLGTACLLLAATLNALPAQAEMPLSQMRAANLARMEAERLNGGLNRYFTASCMHQRGGGSCLVKSDSNGYRFDFLGGPPGWEAMKQPATVETRILISADGSKVVKVIYNGAPH